MGNFTECACLSSSAIMVPSAMVGDTANAFFNTIAACLKQTASGPMSYVCLNDQVIMTQLMLHSPGMFNIVGSARERMFKDQISQMYQLYSGTSELFDWLSAPKGATVPLSKYDS